MKCKFEMQTDDYYEVTLMAQFAAILENDDALCDSEMHSILGKLGEYLMKAQFEDREDIANRLERLSRLTREG